MNIDNKLGIRTIFGAPSGIDAVEIANMAKTGTQILFVARDDVAMAAMEEELSFIAPKIKTVLFPAWDCLPYDRVSPAPSIASGRIEAISKMSVMADKGQTNGGGAVVLTTVSAALQRIPPKAMFGASILQIGKGSDCDIDELSEFLVKNGYRNSHTVVEAGEFARRGGLMDIFPSGAENPVRLDFFGDEVEEIRIFDAISQRTTGNLDALSLKPVSEVPLDDASISRFRTGYRELFGAPSANDILYAAVSDGLRHPGAEHWISLFYENMETIFDYLPDAVIALDHQASDAAASRFKLIDEYYSARKAMSNQKGASLNDQPPYNPVPVNSIYLSSGELEKTLSNRDVVEFSPFKYHEAAPEGTPNATDAGGHMGREFSDARVNPETNVFEALDGHVKELQSKGLKVIIGAYSQGSGERLQTLMDEHSVNSEWVNSLGDALALPANSLAIGVFGMERGFVLASAGFAVISEPDILGERLSRPGKRKIRAENFIADISTLGEGDMVVHAEHGIARFDGLMTIEVQGASHDCLRLVYAGDDKLFLPVENIDIITRFGSEGTGANLDKLGGASWQARKAGMKKRLRDMAVELIKIAAGRELKNAEVMEVDIAAFDEFQSRFPFTETTDQARAISDVVSDLGSGRPTDRLVCGDVGFGKTEVALRAAFVAAMSGRQVALVVPTTLLARQHFSQFKERFSGFPIRVRQLSRLVSTSQAKETKAGLKDGTVDIVVGTHALLAKDVEIKNIGLLIIDEEQHFGVKHKERLKAIKDNVHVLTLSATPIPRTLQLALSGVRKMSLIATPPVDRLAVRTFITPFDPVVVREAIMRERFRGGQTFYVCPRISDQGYLLKTLKELVPEVQVAVVSGQMPANDLEETIGLFYEGKFDILLATNIIESGLDLPQVNTIIIHRADMFGLSQLYQLRGRVGRSKTRAYAYLTLPDGKALTPAAEKRLSVMQSLDSLGAGFQLASHDLDIRGAGNLLGEEQSGHIREVGIELYQQMLEEAVAEARGGSEGGRDEDYSPQVGIGISVMIPENYVSDLHLRLDLYRRIATISDDSEGETFAAEMIDRFGTLPDEVENLLKVVSIKRRCRTANIEKIDAGPKGAVISFKENTFPNPEGLVGFISEQVGTVKLKPDHTLVLKRAWDGADERLRGVTRLVAELADVALVNK